MTGHITDTALDCGDHSRLTLFSLTAIAHLADYEAIAGRTGQNSSATCIVLLEWGEHRAKVPSSELVLEIGSPSSSATAMAW